MGFHLYINLKLHPSNGTRTLLQYFCNIYNPIYYNTRRIGNQAEAEGKGKGRKPSPKPVVTDGDEAGDNEGGRAGKIEPRPAVGTAIGTSNEWTRVTRSVIALKAADKNVKRKR